MSAPKCPVAQFQPFLEDCPELLFIAIRRACYIREIDRYDALIKASVILVFSAVVLCVGDISDTLIREPIRREETSAPHTRVHIAFQLTHQFCADVIRNHAFCCAFCGKLCQIEVLRVFVDVIFIKGINKLWERRSNPCTGLVLYTLYPLFQNLLDNECKVFLFLFALCLSEIQEHGQKRCLPVRGHQGHDLVLYRLDAFSDLLQKHLLYNLFCYLCAVYCSCFG